MYIRVFFIASVVRLVRDGWLLSESDRCILRYFGFSLFRRPLILILCSSFLSPVYLVLFLSPAYFYFVYFCSSPGLFLYLFIFLSFIQSFSLVSFFILIFVVSVRTFLKFPMLNISCVFLVLPCYFFIIFPFKPPPLSPHLACFFQFFLPLSLLHHPLYIFPTFRCTRIKNIFEYTFSFKFQPQWVFNTGKEKQQQPQKPRRKFTSETDGDFKHQLSPSSSSLPCFFLDEMEEWAMGGNLHLNENLHSFVFSDVGLSL